MWGVAKSTALLKSRGEFGGKVSDWAPDSPAQISLQAGDGMALYF